MFDVSERVRLTPGDPRATGECARLDCRYDPYRGGSRLWRHGRLVSQAEELQTMAQGKRFDAAEMGILLDPDEDPLV